MRLQTAGNPVDIHIGKRIRQTRRLRGLSQEQLGERLCLTYQQVQKYETGKNRISAGRLLTLAEVFDVPIGFFFDGLPGIVSAFPGDDYGMNRETLELTRAYYRLPDHMREAVYAFIKRIGAPTEP